MFCFSVIVVIFRGPLREEINQPKEYIEQTTEGVIGRDTTTVTIPTNPTKQNRVKLILEDTNQLANIPN